MTKTTYQLLKAAGIAAALTLGTISSSSADVIKYSPGLVQNALKQGETVLVEFSASWCSICRAQQAVLKSLKSENPNYAKNIKFVDVDWDKYRGKPIAKSMGAQSQSTLVLAKGDKILGRVSYTPSRAEIKELLDKAL